MKRGLVLASFVIACTSAFAQVHGVPASVLSPTVNNPFPGPPASVTSPGPNGFGNTPPVVFFSPQLNSGRGHHRIPMNAVAVPVAVPVYIPLDYESIAGTPSAKSQTEKPDASDPKTEVVVVDSGTLDDVVAKKLAAALDKLAEEKAAKPPAPKCEAGKDCVEAKAATPSVATVGKAGPSAEQIPAEQIEELAVTLFVMRDGTCRELHNYAIVDGALYDLADGAMKKIPLDTVDLDATKKANEQAGKYFRMP